MSKSLRNWIIVLAIGFVIWVCPTPQGLTPNAWHLFAVFAATIAGFILQPISMGAVAFIALTFCAITGVLKTGQALMGFGNGTIWLIVCAFFLSRAFIKTGFGRRIAFLIIKYIGRSSLTLGYYRVVRTDRFSGYAFCHCSRRRRFLPDRSVFGECLRFSARAHSRQNR